MTSEESPTTTDYQPEKLLVRPFLNILILIALLVITLVVAMSWTGQQIHLTDSQSTISSPEALQQRRTMLTNVSRTILIVSAIITLGLLAFGGYRARMTAQKLSQLFIGQIEQQQEQLTLLTRRHFLLSAAMNGIGDAVIAADTQGRVTFLNPVAEELTNWEERDALGRDIKTILTLIDDRTGKEIADPAAAILTASVRMDFPRHVVQVAKDSKQRPITGSGTPIWEQHGKLGGVALIFRDASEQAEAAKTLLDMTAQRVSSEVRAEAFLKSERLESQETLRLSQADAHAATLAESLEQSSLLANMSDELRTPLNTVIGYSEMLQEEVSDRQLDDLIPDLQKIHGAGKHLLSLINDILDLSKIEAKQMALYPETFDVGVLLDEVTATVQPILAKNENTLQVRMVTDLGLMHADKGKIKQSLLNVLSNTAGFSHGHIVALEANRERSKNGNWITFLMADASVNQFQSGDHQLNETSSETETSETARFSAHGLSLVVARHFCEMQGGEFTSTREPGHGVIYRLRFPVNPPG